jgi:choline dehydrogenase
MARTTIIVGAGSGGGALAYRLTENPDEKVILIEAGPDYPDADLIPDDLLDSSVVSVDKHDWHLKARFLEPSEVREPQPYPRGRVVGGSSAVNAAIANRATKEDFDLWASLGNTEWTYEAVLPYFARLENDHDFGTEPGHGASGPIPIIRFPRSEWPEAVLAFEQACVKRGHPTCEDFNARESSGFGPVPRNLLGGNRASSLLTYIAQSRDRENFTLRASLTCRRVVFDGDRAVGVEVEEPDGTRRTIGADRIVLAAGAVHSPQLLMLSGVGPRDELERLGIPIVEEVPGVGRSLQDHILIPVLALLKEDTPFDGVRAKLKFSSSASPVRDDMMLFATLMDPSVINLPFETRGKAAMVMASLLAKPKSTGWLSLRSADVHDQPDIHVNFLSDEADIAPLMEGMRLAWDLTHTDPLREHIDQVVAPDPSTIDDDEKLRDFIKAFGTTSYHTTSTCRMGPDGDAMAVVDQALAVRGLRNLWIGDASVMPRVATGLTNITAYMIGERLADILVTSQNPGARWLR